MNVLSFGLGFFLLSSCAQIDSLGIGNSKAETSTVFSYDSKYASKYTDHNLSLKNPGKKFLSFASSELLEVKECKNPLRFQVVGIPYLALLKIKGGVSYANRYDLKEIGFESSETSGNSSDAPPWYVNARIEELFKEKDGDIINLDGVGLTYILQKEELNINSESFGTPSPCTNKKFLFKSWDENTKNLLIGRSKELSQLKQEISTSWSKGQGLLPELQKDLFEAAKGVALDNRNKFPKEFSQCQSHAANFEQKYKKDLSNLSNLKMKEVTAQTLETRSQLNQMEDNCGLFYYPELTQVKSSCNEVWKFYKKGVEHMQGTDRCLLAK